MWAKVKDNKILQIISHPRSIRFGNVQHPPSIFSTSWTDEERKKIGILPIVFQGSAVTNKFYEGKESAPVIDGDQVVIVRSKVPNSISEVKENLKASINDSLSTTLTPTDWIIIRKIDKGEEGPSDLVKYRNDLRDRAKELEALVDSKNSLEDLQAIPIHEWPKHPRSSRK